MDDDNQHTEQHPAGASVEEWRTVPGFDCYQVSSLGRVTPGKGEVWISS